MSAEPDRSERTFLQRQPTGPCRLLIRVGSHVRAGKASPYTRRLRHAEPPRERKSISGISKAQCSGVGTPTHTVPARFTALRTPASRSPRGRRRRSPRRHRCRRWIGNGLYRSRSRAVGMVFWRRIPAPIHFLFRIDGIDGRVRESNTPTSLAPAIPASPPQHYRRQPITATRFVAGYRSTVLTAAPSPAITSRSQAARPPRRRRRVDAWCIGPGAQAFCGERGAEPSAGGEFVGHRSASIG